MPFDSFVSFVSENIGGLVDFGEIGSIVDNFGTEFLAEANKLVTDFNIPLDNVPSLGGWDVTGTFAGSADWFDTFNVGSILDSIPSISDFNLSSLTDSLPSLSSIKDFAGSVSDTISTGYKTITQSIPSLDKIKEAATSVQKAIDPYVKTAQKVVTTYQKAAPAVNAVASALGVQNPITQFIQPLSQAVGLAGAASGIAGGVASGITNVQNAGNSAASAAEKLFGTSDTDRAETYNQAIKTVESTDTALKQYDAEKQAATSDILRTSDNIGTIQSKLEDPNISDEERSVAEEQLKGEYDKLAVAQQSLEQTNNVISQVTTARDSAAQIVAKTDLNTIKTPFKVDEYGLVILDAKQTATLEKNNLRPGFVNSIVDPNAQPRSETYNQARATVESTTSALKQYDADKAAATSDILKTSDNIYNINARLEDPNTSAEEKALLEEQLKGEYDKLAETQQILEQTNSAIDQVSAAQKSAADIVANTDANTINAPGNIGTAVSQFKTAYNSVTGTWSIFDTTGATVQSGLTQQQAILAEQNLNISSGVSLNTGNILSAAAAAAAVVGGSAVDSVRSLFGDTAAAAANAANSATAALTNQARAQQSVRELRNTKAQASDWRVRLRLAPNSNYLYNSPQPGILSALKLTDGVIFPYTPSIDTAYKANYDAYDLTHSNYRGYFYKSSHVDAVNIRAQFTAQDTKEADYLLAVIHFFRSCTKMFYGQDAQRGSPPPLVYLNGYGDYQFNEHPCVVSQFNYTLPPDVDYIRAQSTLQNNTNRLNSRLRNPLANNPLAYSVNRLLNSNLVQGALTNSPVATTNNLASSTPTYVPTKMEISITLFPIQSRSQVSNNFSVKEFANGNLLKGGYW